MSRFCYNASRLEIDSGPTCSMIGNRRGEALFSIGENYAPALNFFNQGGNVKIFVVLTVLIFQLIDISYVFAGGAAMQRGRPQPGGQKQQMQQQAMQQQAIQRQAMQQQAVQRLQQEAVQKNIAIQANVHNIQSMVPPSQEEVKDVVDFNQLIQVLEKSSRPWNLIIDQEAKEMVVAQFMKQYYQQGTQIHKSPVYYVPLIDDMSVKSPQILAQPFPQVLRMIAVLEYDFDNGQDKDAMALKILGSPQALAANKKRLGLQ